MDLYARRQRSTKSVDPFFRSASWKAFRAQVLARRARMCARCGRPVAMNERIHLDHRVPRRKAPERAFDESNIELLCHPCHSKKTAARDGGFGNPMRDPDAVDGRCDAAGDPLDPEHPWNRG